MAHFDFENQDLLVRGLAILQTLKYVNPRAIRSNKLDRTTDTTKKLRLLDTIAAGLATGKGGDVAAATFVDEEFYVQTHGPNNDDAKTFVLLAKNNVPSARDKELATEFFDIINDSETTNPGVLFPFLLRWCKESMRNRVKLLVSLLRNKGFQRSIQSELDKYQGLAGNPFDINEEFGRRSLTTTSRRLVNQCQPNGLKILWDILIDSMETNGLVFSTAKETKPSQEAYEAISDVAYDILQSAFLRRHLLADAASAQYNQALQFKQRLSNIHIYTRPIGFLLEQVHKRGMRPIKHFWVEEEPSEAQFTYGPFNPSFRDEFRRVMERLAPQAHPPLDSKLFESDSDVALELQKSWVKFITSKQGKPKEFRAYLHCELCIVNCVENFYTLDHSDEFIGPTSTSENRFQGDHFLSTRPVVPIGVSKRSCVMCAWVLNQHGQRNPNRLYITSGDHGKAYARWFNPSTAYTSDILSVLHEQIEVAVPGAVDRKNIAFSDEYLSSSGDERRPEETQSQVDGDDMQDDSLPLKAP